MKKLLFILPLLIWVSCEDSDSTPTEVTLWGEVYSVENTTELDLSNNQLTGEIPSEIGQLTNLFSFGLSNNQLSGIIPEEICNIGDTTPSLSNNQFCPPYPSCIEDYVGEQDTTNCN